MPLEMLDVLIGLEDEGTDTQGFVAVDDSVCIVAFRGTETKFGSGKMPLQDFVTDAKFKPKPWTFGKKSAGYGKVHTGFLEALDSVWKDLNGSLEELRKDGQALWFTGHSLGGALAMLTVGDHARENYVALLARASGKVS